MPHNQSLTLHASILIVDSDATHNFILARMLEWAGYANVVVCEQPEDALVHYERHCPDLLLMDLFMPGTTTISLLEQLKSGTAAHFLPVIAFVRSLDRDSRRLAVSHGASDILVKFGDSDDVLLRVKNFLQIRNLHRQLREENLTLEEVVRVRTSALERAQQDLAERMAQAIEYRHDEFGDHASRVGYLAADMAQLLGMNEGEVTTLRLAAGFHDVGNVAVPDLILLKPGPLSPEEREVMQIHASVGGEMLSRGHSDLLRTASIIARHHHERWDGRGYPSGLHKEEIPLAARIVAVADVFDALMSDRPYRGRLTFEDAIEEINRLSGSHFDPAVVGRFHQVVDRRRVA